MPVYNGGHYFEEAVESALAQTYDGIEIVMVNDGSTDEGRTHGVCQRFARAHPDRVVYIEQENTGAGGALNAGVRAMTGDIFCWLSHDDLYEPFKIERQVDFHNRLGRRDAILISDYRLIDPVGKVLHEVRLPHAYALAHPRLPLYRGWVNGCTVFIPADFLDRRGAFESQYRHVQDYRLWHKLLERHEFFHQPELLVRYRLHPGQDSRRPDAVEEGEALWTEMMEGCGPAQRAQMSGSSYLFYEGARRHLSESMYPGVVRLMEAARDRCIAETLVSVVIPVFNEEDVALRALESVLTQSHAKLDVIVIDDGSSEPLDRLKAACAADPRARLVRQENAGAGAARNRGLSLAKGEYVAFLDSDDLFLPEKIERQLDAMQRAGALISHTSYYVTYPQRRDGAGLLRSGRFTGKVYPDILGGCAIATPTVMIHRLLIAEGFAFPTDTPLSEDVLTWIEAVRRRPLLGLDDPLSVVEWSDTSAAVDLRKAARGVRHQVQALRRDFVHSRQPELKRLEAYAERAQSRLDALRPGETFVDTALIDEVFAEKGSLRTPLLQPRAPFDPQPFFEATEILPAPSLELTDAQLVDPDEALRLSRRPMDLRDPAHSFKYPAEAGEGEARFSTGRTAWDYLAALALHLSVDKDPARVEAVVNSTEPVFALLVDDGFQPVSERQPVPAGLHRIVFPLEDVPAAHALVIQAGADPWNRAVVIERVVIMSSAEAVAEGL